MNYEQFKKTKSYAIFSDYMQLMTGMFFLDPENKGMTFSELEKKFDGDLTRDQISMGTDMGHDRGEIQEENQFRGDWSVHTYILSPCMRRSLELAVELMSK
ncbi:hypothetical protein KY348_06870 [Candidatus Woesearchaeota archaeon]|nr:hypothetical protein [Candidatus Woesearchaeota archaeon]